MGRSLYRDLNRRFGPQIDGPTRREMLKATLAVGATLLISNSALARAARLSSSAGAADGAKRVVIIGAGFAGLACAYELRAAGYDVTVVEARDRIGGRVLSFNKDLKSEYVPGRNVEGGAELIGSNHPTWVAYADRFKLDFLEIKETEGLAYPVVLDGKALEPAEAEALWEKMEAALSKLDPLAADLDPDKPWTAENAADLDKRSIQSWIDALDADEQTKKACWINQSSDNGVDPRSASLLGQLTCIKGGGLDKYWTDTEVYRCKGGNSLLAHRLLAEIGPDRVITGLPVTRVAAKGRNVLVTCRDGRTIECDDVVLAVPPSAWHRIDIKPGFPAALSTSGIQMGTAVKYFSHVKRRYWQDNKLDPVALCNSDISWTWDSTDGQDEPVEGNPNPPEHPACLAAFSGGPAAERARSRKGDEQRRAYSKELNTLYPGYADFVVTTRFMDWPDAPFTGAGYSFPAPGQVTGTGPLLAKPHAGRVHLAGEHCCYKFVGYMEGALQSGVAVAKRIAGA